MAKIWCEKCKGRGQVTGYKTYDMPPLEKCKSCHGKGYTEVDVIETEAVRKKLQDEVGTGRSAVLVLSELLKEDASAENLDATQTPRRVHRHGADDEERQDND